MDPKAIRQRIVPAVISTLVPRPAKMLPDELDAGESSVTKFCSVGWPGSEKAEVFSTWSPVLNAVTSRIQKGSSITIAAMIVTISMTRVDLL